MNYKGRRNLIFSLLTTSPYYLYKFNLHFFIIQIISNQILTKNLPLSLTSFSFAIIELSDDIFKQIKNLKNQILKTHVCLKQHWFDKRLVWNPKEYGNFR